MAVQCDVASGCGKEAVYFSVMGVPVSNHDADSLWEAVRDKIALKKSAVIVAINPEKVMAARRDENVYRMLSTFDFPIVDGVAILMILKMNRIAIRRRLTGIDTMEMLIDRSRGISARLFFYGAKPGIAEKAVESLTRRFPGITVAGILDGYQKDQSLVVEKIKESGAKIVFVALGSPTQEKFMFENRDKLEGCILQGVGGSFDVFSGDKARAPLFFRKLGLEWFYRLLCEPWRLKRQLVIVKFLMKYFISPKRNEKATL